MSVPSISWSQALAWRMGRQFLDLAGGESVAGVVRRLAAVQAQNDAAAELSVRVRRERSEAGDVAHALAEGSIIKTFAFRGATHLMAADDAGAYLALRASSRMWELPSWRTFYGLEPSDWPALRAAVRGALAGGPMTREELGAAVIARPRFAHLGFAFGEHAGTLLKPFAWQGDMSFGPPRDGRATFQRLDSNTRWTGLPVLADAGIHAVEAYFRAYGPATSKHVQYWLGEGLGAARRNIEAWIGALGPRLVHVDVQGTRAFVLADDIDELLVTRETATVRLLPGLDQWVLGPGTADPHVVPTANRALVSRGANIALVGGVVSGTWTLRRDRVVVAWFGRAGEGPRDALIEEGGRLGRLFGRNLDVAVESARDQAARTRA